MKQEKNHFGPAPNKLMSDAWNMSTSVSSMKNGREDPNFKRIAQAAQTVEMDLRFSVFCEGVCMSIRVYLYVLICFN